jgi:Ca2+-binding RTX toxin-like protein
MSRFTPAAPGRRRTRRLALASAILPAAIAAVALPGAAEAATLTTSGSTVQYQAAANETNGLRVFKEPTGALVLDDVVSITETSPNCFKIDATSARCVNYSTLAAVLGNNNDTFFTQDGGTFMSVDAGSGDDTYLGGFANGVSTVRYFGNTGTDTADYRNATSAVTVKKDGAENDGRLGEDDNISSDVETVVGSRFADTLEGSNSTRTEIYDGLAGNDTLNGLGGPDLFQSGAAVDGADRIEGGSDAAKDSLSYEQRFVGVDVTVNFFDNDDGQPGEKDTVRGIETVFGGKGGDDIAASGASNNAVTLLGGDGIDTLVGSNAGDTLIGQKGTDTLRGNGGGDTFQATDKELDTLFCGDGIDTAHRDLREAEVLSCEGGIVTP